ncbi:MAG TPA: nucleotidyltransferase domain-containing protein [Geminicoccaceae bacterium]|nr:nucleotidyltransferase domain-containing protein [Geminicoccaceae bacterium]
MEVLVPEARVGEIEAIAERMRAHHRDPAHAAAHPALQEFKRRIHEALPGRITRVVLFGSRARGDYRDASDWDVAVFFRGGYDPWQDLGVLTEATLPVPDREAEINPIGFDERRYDEASELMRHIREEGVPL